MPRLLLPLTPLIGALAACHGPPAAVGGPRDAAPAEAVLADATPDRAASDGAPAAAADATVAPAFTDNCTEASCRGGVDYFAPGDPGRYRPLPMTPEQHLCLGDDTRCADADRWLAGPVAGSDLDDLVALFAPALRARARAYLAHPDNRGVLVIVGGWGAQNTVGGFMYSAAAWANEDPRLQLPVIQLGYYAPCWICVTEYAAAQADGLARGQQLLAKLRRAGITRVLWLAHSAGADLLGKLAAWGHAEPGFGFAWAFAAPSVPPLVESLLVPPDGPDATNRTGGFFRYRAYVTRSGATVDYGGALALFNRASDCAANTGWSYLDCVDLPTHDYSGVLRAAGFRAALWEIHDGSYAFPEALHGDPAEGHADRAAGLTYDCLERCP